MSATAAAQAAIVRATIAFVKETLSGHDGSHDIHHIMRVHKMALRLAKDEGADEHTTEITELSALLHDIADWKYSGSETAGAETAAAFLRAQCYDETKIREVTDVINNVSFHSELGGAVCSSAALPIVQDADRLDAIGAIGIARCFTFGGTKGRALYDPDHPIEKNLTKEAYMSGKAGPSVNHFYEKLLKLKDMMKTESGRKVAQQRHEYMQGFLDQFFDEWDSKK